MLTNGYTKCVKICKHEENNSATNYTEDKNFSPDKNQVSNRFRMSNFITVSLTQF